MEEGLPKIPKLELAQFKFLLLNKCNNAEATKQKLLDGIVEDSII
jgi:hypothetical protein